jgi:hypothetical protein
LSESVMSCLQFFSAHIWRRKVNLRKEPTLVG